MLRENSGFFEVSGLFLPLVMAARLAAIAARLHIAPAAAPVLTRIHEQPSAILGGAGPYGIQFLVGEQIRRRPHHLPENRVKINFPAGPIPCKTTIFSYNTRVAHRLRKSG